MSALHFGRVTSSHYVVYFGEAMVKIGEVRRRGRQWEGLGVTGLFVVRTDQRKDVGQQLLAGWRRDGSPGNLPA